MTNAQRSINPFELGKRLQALRKLSGRTQLQIAESLGLSRPSVAAVESGQRRVDSRLLAGLARAYEVPISALVRDSGPPATLSSQFRLPPDDRDAAREDLEKAVLSLERLASSYLRLEELLDSPLRANPVPRYGYESRRLEADAERTADAERRRLGIGDGPVLRLRGVLEREAGLRIFHIPLPSGIAGLYGLSPEAGPCVAINARHPLVRQRWSLAHEFGHFLTRVDLPEVTRVSRYQRVPEQERFAERFAGAFLMPGSGLDRRVAELESDAKQITVADLLLLADEYEVSFQALVLRLEDVRRLPSGTWDTLTNSGTNIRAASRVLGIAPAPADTSKLPSRFVYFALEAYEKELLTERELADLLGVDRLMTRRIIDQLTTKGLDVDEAAIDISLSESMSLAN